MARKRTSTNILNLAQYKQFKATTQHLLNNLAVIADHRGEMLRTYELDAYDTDSPPQSDLEPLSELLKTKASTLDSPFRLAVVGHFCRGKSTLINAMLNRKLLTGDLRPNTATSAILRYGNPERFRVTFKSNSGKQPKEYFVKSPEDLASSLAQFTSEAAVASDVELNENCAISGDVQKYIDLMQGKKESLAQLIDVVEVWCGSEFLNSNNIEIIDTPGLGSVFKEHKQVTLNIIPNVDATIFVVQPDPGISKREAAFIELIKEQVANIFFVVTKADQIAKEEIPEMLDFIRDVVKNTVGFPVEHIYPVSAINALRGNWNESGFSLFMPSLQRFLLENNGVGRLLSSSRVARGYCDQMIIYVEKDIKAQSQSLRELYDERHKIQLATRQIKLQKQELIDTIDSRIQEIILQALHGLESIPAKIRKNVEQKIDSLNLQQLENADEFLQPVMKDTVVCWLRENQTSFEKEMNRLNHRVKQEVKEMLGDIQSFREQQIFDRNFEIQLNSPISTNNLISTSIGNDIVKMLTSMKITGIVANFIGGLIDVSSEFVNGVRNFIGGLFGGRSRLPQSSQHERLQKARQKIREVLLAEVENSTKNAYEVMIEGYINDNSQQINGVRNVIEEIFQDWGIKLQECINNLINSNVNARLNQLNSQIKQLENNTSEEDLKNNIEMYRQQEQHLQDLLLQICELETSLAAFKANPPLS